ncbi:terminase large subunit [Frigidibacter oleivorans]|uniref:terminase large subunit n=1 Tax=Frigidibacter oleivorans TaxID=2487129 RepID=UPI000F8C5A61|nr:terminase TerL endonuclease subunit [Frigidibacter oleivorans]
MPITIKKKPQAKIAIDCNPFPEIPDPMGYGQRAVDFIRTLKHPQSNLPGHAFQLDPWQERIIRQIYGPRHPNGNRIVRNAVLLVPRGNRKTTLAAALILLHGQGPERRSHAQLVSVASDRKQAKLVHAEASGMIDPDYAFTPALGNTAKTVDARRGAKLRDNTNKIIFPGGIVYEALSSDAGTAQGRTPSLVIADEVHAWAKRDPRELWGAMKAGAAKVANSLVVVTTTAGTGQENLAFDIIDYARRVAKGDIDDPATLPVLYETTADADWRDEAVWHACNPGLEFGYPDLEGLRQSAVEAEHKPAERAIFKRYHLNIWQQQSAAPFVDLAVYDRGAEPVDLDALQGEPCWLGVDLSSTSDLTAIVAAWRDSDGGYIVHPWYFCPGDNLNARQTNGGIPYVSWAEQGFIEPTPGNVIDYDTVEDRIMDLCDRFDVREIAVDPWGARRTLNNLLEAGLPAVEMRQGMVTMAPACRELERAILAGKLRHGGHPILRWNFDNVTVESDAAGNIKFNKSKSREKIDGAVAAAMAVARAAQGDDFRSVYEDTAQRPDGFLIW